MRLFPPVLLLLLHPMRSWWGNSCRVADSNFFCPVDSSLFFSIFEGLRGGGASGLLLFAKDFAEEKLINVVVVFVIARRVAIPSGGCCYTKKKLPKVPSGNGPGQHFKCRPPFCLSSTVEHRRLWSSSFISRTGKKIFFFFFFLSTNEEWRQIKQVDEEEEEEEEILSYYFSDLQTAVGVGGEEEEPLIHPSWLSFFPHPCYSISFSSLSIVVSDVSV